MSNICCCWDVIWNPIVICLWKHNKKFSNLQVFSVEINDREEPVFICINYVKCVVVETAKFQDNQFYTLMAADAITMTS